jgi:hypothetical protein
MTLILILKLVGAVVQLLLHVHEVHGVVIEVLKKL